MFRTLMIAAAAALSVMIASSANAAGPGGLARGLEETATMSFINERSPGLAPFAFVKFCLASTDDCAVSEGVQVERLTADKRDDLNLINHMVNKDIRPKNDRNGPGNDVWQIGATSGDCEDYALTKRRMLIEMGWSARSLRIAVALTAQGEGHAVLVVKTSAGDLVLDNRSSAIKHWRRTDLAWLKIQSSDNPRRWYGL